MIDAELITAQKCELGMGMFVLRAFSSGEAVIDFSDAMPAAERSYQTLEIARHTHVYSEAIAFVNHCCDPNLVVDVQRHILVSIRQIELGEMLTIFYPATEWELSRPFLCQCGVPGCLGWVTGAKDLPEEVLLRYQLSPHVDLQLRERLDC